MSQNSKKLYNVLVWTHSAVSCAVWAEDEDEACDIAENSCDWIPSTYWEYGDSGADCLGECDNADRLRYASHGLIFGTE